MQKGHNMVNLGLHDLGKKKRGKREAWVEVEDMDTREKEVSTCVFGMGGKL